MSTPIVWLDDEVDPALAGGKGVGLGHLFALDLPVPPGFVVSTDAYRSHVRTTGLLDGIADALRDASTVDAQAEASESIGKLFADTVLTEDLDREIRRACTALAGTGSADAPVAVRSSATAEDTPEASFAGQQESYLWIRGADAVIEHVAKCWASLFTRQAIAYRHDRRIDAGEIAMGVVVQQMVPASVAGVMMTLDPANGDPSQVTIEAAYGLGLGVVSGEVTPDKYTVDKVSLGIRGRDARRKPAAYRFDEGSGTVRLVDVPSEEQEQPCLTDGEVVELARLGKRIEDGLGGAQDVEWAFGPGAPGERTAYLLQTRPETVWSRRKRDSVAAAGSTTMDRMMAMMRTPIRLKD